MTMTFFAQPYDISATGFYFESGEEFAERAAKARNDYGQRVEEFEIQFIDGEAIDAALASAIGIHQGNIAAFIELAEGLDEHEKRVLIIAGAELGYAIDPKEADPEAFDIDIYEGVTMRELAEQFVDEGLFGQIPEHLAHYIDYDTIARDLAMDYTETEIAGVG
ncbi:MAG: antirestriction protein ArdA [Alphaproteobacteria bacterium]|nr:antirestriction protein ArdA [Alphaproteobacteria bacterium]